MDDACWIFLVAGIHPSGSFESVRWLCMCAQTRPRFIFSSKRILGNGVRNQVNSKGKNPLYRRLRGGRNARRLIRQDSEFNTLPTELLEPRPGISDNYGRPALPSYWFAIVTVLAHVRDGLAPHRLCLETASLA